MVTRTHAANAPRSGNKGGDVEAAERGWRADESETDTYGRVHTCGRVLNHVPSPDKVLRAFLTAPDDIGNENAVPFDKHIPRPR
jgi:hypothetical protein